MNRPLVRSLSAKSHGRGWRETHHNKKRSRCGGCGKHGLPTRRTDVMVLERVLGDSTAALTPEEGRPPVPTKTLEGDARRSDLPESVASHRPRAETTPSESETSMEGGGSHQRDKRRRRWRRLAGGSRGGGLTRGKREGDHPRRTRQRRGDA